MKSTGDTLTIMALSGIVTLTWTILYQQFQNPTLSSCFLSILIWPFSKKSLLASIWLKRPSLHTESLIKISLKTFFALNTRQWKCQYLESRSCLTSSIQSSMIKTKKLVHFRQWKWHALHLETLFSELSDREWEKIRLKSRE